MLNLIPALLLCFLVHEGGHWLAARCFGRKIKFRFAWGKFYVPRYIWDMPAMERSKQRIVAAAGFCAEWVVGGTLYCLGWPYMCAVFIAHFAAYPVYAGEASDFKWFKGGR